MSQSLIQDMQDVLLPILFEDEVSEENAFMTLEYNSIDKEDWGHDAAEAYVAHSSSMFCSEETGLVFCQDFEIDYLSCLVKDEPAFKRMLAHEFVHIMQTCRGDEFDYSKPYAEQEHEIEAYDLQDWLVFYYNMRKAC